MIIKKICIENYKSFETQVDFDLVGETKETNKNIILIGGMNGAGKTSLLEAINICLYGLPKSEIFKRINRNQLRRGNALVRFELHLFLDSGDNLVVIRKWKANRFQNDIRFSDLEEELIVKQNNEIKRLSQDLWQDYLNVTIPEGITKFFFFDGEKIQEIATEEHMGVRLKNDMEAVLGIELIRTLIDDLKKNQYEMVKSSNDISRVDIDKLDNDIKYTEDKIKEFEMKLKDLEKDRIDYEDEKKILEDKIRKILGFDPVLLGRKNEFTKQKLQLTTRQTQIQNDTNKLCSNVLPYMLMSNFFIPLLKQIEQERKIRRSKILIENAEEVAREIINSVLLPLIESHKEIATKEVQQKIVEILKKDTGNIGHAILNLSEDDEEQLFKYISNFESEYRIGLEPLLEEEEKINRELKQLEKNLQDLEIPLEVQNSYRELSVKKDEVSEILGRTRQKYVDTEESIFVLKEKLQKQKNERDSLIVSFEGTKYQQDLLNKYNKIINTLEDYIETLKKAKIEDLEKYIFEMYKKLSSKGELLKSVTIDSETYEVSLWDTHEERLNKKQMSQGEKEVFAISLLWALAKSTNFQLPVIIDTPLARLDSSHREQIVREYFPSAGGQVILLSTDEEIRPNDKYYKLLQPFVVNEYTINFDKILEYSELKKGYFL